MVEARGGGGGGRGAQVVKADGLATWRRTEIKENTHCEIHRAIFPSDYFRPSLAMFAVSLLFLLSAPCLFAQQGNEKTFDSPGDAVLALYNAVKSNDSQAITRSLAPTRSNPPYRRRRCRQEDGGRTSSAVTTQMHRVVMEPDQTVTLYVGADNWPMPIPLVKNNSGAWYFDTEAGKQEILYRRIGRNENDAIEVLLHPGRRPARLRLRDPRRRQDQALRHEVHQR